MDIDDAPHVVVEERNFAFQNRLRSFSILNRGYHQPQVFFTNAYHVFEPPVAAVVQEYYLIKLVSCLVADFEKVTITEDGEQVETQRLYLWTNAVMLDFETSLREFYDENVVVALNQRIDDIELRGSNFTLKAIVELNIQISSFDPLSVHFRCRNI